MRKAWIALVERFGDRWWAAVLSGFLMVVCLPPFEPGTHWTLSLFPLLSAAVLLPLFVFATNARMGRAVQLSWLYGAAASASQYYWIVFDTAEGVWHLIIIGVILLCAFFGAYYLAMGMLFRLCVVRVPRRFTWVLFPALWVIGEYLRTLGEISFPWTLIGYTWGSILPFAQLASVGGVYLLSFIVVAGNVVLWDILTADPSVQRRTVCRGWIYVVLLTVTFFWGVLRLRPQEDKGGAQARACCLQVNFDPLRRGEHTLDSAFMVAESLVYAAAQSKPDLLVLPESAFLCYLVRRAERALTVSRWVDSVRIPLVLGALHWERGPDGSPYRHLVYNTAFLVDPATKKFIPYFKMKLVPFSEALPFEGVIPILSRVNLGEADFKRGRDSVVFTPTPVLRAVPFICYEVIYPDFVRRRVAKGGNLIVNITNDGWFGKSPGPYHHAAMARLRCIENGISMVRCANTGISMFVDQYGRRQSRTRLMERTVLCDSVSLERRMTLYAVLGDWVVWCSIVIVVACWSMVIITRRHSRAPGEGQDCGSLAPVPADTYQFHSLHSPGPRKPAH